MNIFIQCILIIGSLISIIFVVLCIRWGRGRFRIDDTVSWILMAFSLLVISLFPNIVISLAYFLGFESPINFVFLFIIFLLLQKVFCLSLQISQLEYKVSTLVQKIAIEEHERKTQEVE